MNPFPEAHALISAFESEPEVLDPEAPWFYNTLTFSGTRAGRDYRVRISPAYGELELRLACGGRPVADLSVAGVTALRVAENAAGTVLMASFGGESGRGLLKLRLKPELAVEWVSERT